MDKARLAEIKAHDAELGAHVSPNYESARDRRDLLEHMAKVWSEGFEAGLQTARHVAAAPSSSPDAAPEAKPRTNPYEQLGFDRNDRSAGA